MEKVDIDVETAIQARTWALECAVNTYRDSPYRTDGDMVINKAKRYEEYILTGE